MTLMNFVLRLMFQGVFPCFGVFGTTGTENAMAKAEAGQAAQMSGQLGQQSATEGAQLNPFFSQEMRAQHSMTPGQSNEMLTAAESGAGGAFGGAEGVMNANAARTGNATSLNKSLDEMARDRAKSAAGASEGIAARDVEGAKQLNQQGAAGMQGLYGTNMSGQLGAMKQQNASIQEAAATEAPSLMSDLQQINSLAPKMPGM